MKQHNNNKKTEMFAVYPKIWLHNRKKIYC